MVLRFFAFNNTPQDYKGYFADFLDEYLRRGMKFTPAEIEQHRQLFLTTIKKVEVIFGNNAFRKFNESDNGWEQSVNRAIYDVIMLSFSRLDEAALINQKDKIIKSLKELNKDAEFTNAITFSTKDKKKIQVRIDKWWKKLSENGLGVPYLKIGD